MKKKVLFASFAGSNPLPDDSFLKLAAHGSEATIVQEESAALQAIEREAFQILVINQAAGEVCKRFKASTKERGRIIFWTNQSMEAYSKALHGEEDRIIDFFIASHEPRPFTLHELRVCLQKLLAPERDGIFGVEKYLKADSAVQSGEIKGSRDRTHYFELIQQFALKNHLSSNQARLASGIIEELIMNAIYDAPLEAGRLTYKAIPRTAELNLKEGDYSTATYGYDGQILAIGISDPFGALTRPKFYQYIKKVLKRSDPENFIDTKETGAGLGLYKILYSCHSLICNVSPRHKTEVIALIDTAQQLRDFSRMPRSIHYFQID